MFEVRGKHNSAKIFTDNADEKAIAQIIFLCNQEFAKDSQIRIMPDTHAGAGCTIGTTMTIKDKVVPNLVGVDIGCGMQVVELGNIEIDYAQLDKVIRTYVPSGCTVREDEAHPYAKRMEKLLNELKCKNSVNIDRAIMSIGTLGGGNHFIELNVDSKGNKYLVIHSGSRHLGKQVAKYYQTQASRCVNDRKDEIEAIIAKMKAEGRQKEIQTVLNSLPKPEKVPNSMAYVVGKAFDDYMHDMTIVQMFATINRGAIADEILRNMGIKGLETFTTIHNYIDMKTMTLRKGAVSAQKDEILLIPINMRDGSLLCKGKGNPDWNYSAPHGAGRLYPRSKAKEMITLEEFEESMQGIYTTSVGQGTIDESPMAYKPMEEIIANVQDTVDILEIIKPLYNFKASDLEEEDDVELREQLEADMQESE